MGVVIGKHPDLADFVKLGGSRAALDVLDQWQEDLVTGLTNELGEDFAAFYDAAPSLRIWFGPGLVPGGAMGVLAPSRDAIGRRYPLGYYCTPTDHPCPVDDPDQAEFAEMERALGAAASLARLVADDDQEATAEADVTAGLIWASRPGSAPERLLRDAQTLDRQVAVAQRSYLWAIDGAVDQTHLLATSGFPTLAEMRWLMGESRVSNDREEQDA